VFFAAWLSHVPPNMLDDFLATVRRAVRPGGRLFMVDEPAGGAQLSGPNANGMEPPRVLHDGRALRIVKVYYRPDDLAQRLRQHGFEQIDGFTGAYFFYLTGVRKSSS
jgi:hypothetical protein